MPKINGSITAVDNGGQPIWQAGDRKIWKVTVNVSGRIADAKTYSQTIARVGFSGDMEAYEKPGRDGSETFLKQYQDPNASSTYQGQGSSGSQGSATFQATSHASYQPKDEGAIKAMWAIGQAIATLGPVANMTDVESTANALFHMVDRVKNSAEVVPENPHANDTPWGTASEPDPSELNGLFPNEQVDDGSNQWPPASTHP